MQNDTLYRIEISLPRRLLKRLHCRTVPGSSASSDPGSAEIYILGVVFVVEAWREETHDMHLRHASVAGEVLHDFAVTQLALHLANQLAYDVTQSMSLLLSRDMACDAT